MEWHQISPELSMAVLAVAVVVLDLFIRDKKLVAWLGAVGLIVPLAFTIDLWNEGSDTIMNDMLAVDQFALFFKFLIIGITALVFMSSWEYVTTKIEHFRGEFYALVLLSALGLMLLAAARDMISIYVALELSSMSLYALTAFLKDRKSTEAGLKYLILGGIASATLLYGMVLVFGMTGTTYLDGVKEVIADIGVTREPVLFLGVVLVAVGFAFKIAAVPFHMWVPDVYEGAPTPITAYLSVASKAAGFAVILRIFFEAFGKPGWLFDDWTALFAVLSAITMTVGNILAIQQTNIKRLLGYSGVAQAGYLMVGLAGASAAGEGQSGIMFFLVVYSLANLGAFIAIIAISNKIGSDEISDYSGMIKRAPVLALVLGICLISLTGIPPTGGFIGKLLVFKSAMDEGLLWLVIFAVVNSVIAAFYYFKVIKVMFLGEAKSEEPVTANMALEFALIISTVGVFVLGIYPYAVSKYADIAAMLIP
ncbi:MAG: NADH-quinone oxidoreductase subunit N [Dehalococcoidia bacterium]